MRTRGSWLYCSHETGIDFRTPDEDPSRSSSFRGFRSPAPGHISRPEGLRCRFSRHPASAGLAGGFRSRPVLGRRQRTGDQVPGGPFFIRAGGQLLRAVSEPDRRPRHADGCRFRRSSLRTEMPHRTPRRPCTQPRRRAFGPRRRGRDRVQADRTPVGPPGRILARLRGAYQGHAARSGILSRDAAPPGSPRTVHLARRCAAYQACVRTGTQLPRPTGDAALSVLGAREPDRRSRVRGPSRRDRGVQGARGRIIAGVRGQVRRAERSTCGRVQIGSGLLSISSRTHSSRSRSGIVRA
jgi:hypothetical protein